MKFKLLNTSGVTVGYYYLGEHKTLKNNFEITHNLSTSFKPGIYIPSSEAVYAVPEGTHKFFINQNGRIKLDLNYR